MFNLAISGTNVPSVNSLQISKEFGREHYDVLKSIRKVMQMRDEDGKPYVSYGVEKTGNSNEVNTNGVKDIGNSNEGNNGFTSNSNIRGKSDNGFTSNFDITYSTFLDQKGEERTMYILNEKAALICMPFIGGLKSFEGQVALVTAFLELRDVTKKLVEELKHKYVKDYTKPTIKIKHNDQAVKSKSKYSCLVVFGKDRLRLESYATREEVFAVKKAFYKFREETDIVDRYEMRVAFYREMYDRDYIAYRRKFYRAM